jgi:RND family efflux transporter MFP subunit
MKGNLMKLARIKQHSKMHHKLLVVMLVLLTLLFISWLIYEWLIVKKPTENRVAVQAASVKIRGMPVILQEPGSVESIQSVTITPQVTGILKKIAFKLGQEVNKNQLLFEIDPAPFLATLQQMQATLRRDQAQLLQAQRDAKRYAVLVCHEFVTKQQAEQTQTAVATQAQLVAADLAQVKQAEIQLGYTKIYTPIAGRTGNVVVRVGNLLVANSPNALVIINQLNPIWIDFNIPQTQLPHLLFYQHRARLPAKIFTDDGRQLLSQGILTFVDNTVNNQAGTVLLKAEVPNQDRHLWPGQLVTAQITLTTQPKAITVPISAVQIDEEGNFVYIVTSPHTVKVRRIKLDRQVGNLAVIAQGLQGNETVLTIVPPNFTERLPVDISFSHASGFLALQPSLTAQTVLSVLGTRWVTPSRQSWPNQQHWMTLSITSGIDGAWK